MSCGEAAAGTGRSRAPIEMDDVVVDELAGRCVPCDDARAESRGQPGHEGGGDR